MARTSFSTKVGKLGLALSLALAVAMGCGGTARRGAHDPTRVAEDLGRAMALIDAGYTDIVARDRLYRGAVRGMLAELDPHSSYFDAEEFSELQAQSSGDRVGIGVELDLRGGRARVIAPIEGGPAARAGVQSGDEIVGVDGHTAELEGPEKMLRRLRGEAGRTVTLSIRRGEAELKLILARDSLHFACSVTHTLSGELWYLRIRSFQQGCHQEISRAWESLPKPKPKGILLDLRANPGGLVTEATSLADEWLEHGDIVRLYARGAMRESTPASAGGMWVGIPTVSLVNRWSASAAEILAGALQDAAAATIAGEPSYGKGTVQAVVPLPSGGGMALTIARYTTPSGRYIQGQGIVPDVLFEQSASALTSFALRRESELPGALAAPIAQPRRSTKNVHIAGSVDNAALLSDNDAWALAAASELRVLVAAKAVTP